MSVSDSRSPPNTSARRAAVERAILDAAEALLAEESFHALTVEDVMKKAGLTRTAFYRYFPDLEAVLLRRMSELHAELAVAADLWLDLDAEPTESIFAANTGLAEVYDHHGRILLAFADAAGRGPEIEKAWHDTVHSFVAPVVARIEDLAARGLTKVPNIEETARALVWMNERYLLETFGRRSGADVRLAAQTLSEIWHRVLFA
ncbi:MAG: TetR/AcrR family transcriptional regulator [Actinomycetota bacterium]|nr:TetR/AcrR family transcriptional regulator [Actinomycetota bacterium]